MAPPPHGKTKSSSTLSSCATLLALRARLLRVGASAADAKQGAANRRHDHDEPPKLVTYAEFRRILMKSPAASSLLEHSARSLLFVGNLGEIGRHNLASLSGRETYFIGQSPFKSDLTRAEQEAAALLAPGPIGAYADGSLDRPVGSPFGGLFGAKKGGAYNLDADQTDCLGAIRTQGHCGACYAFSLMSLVEWHYCKQTPSRKPVDFAEQFLVDCGAKNGLNGCKEGRITLAKDFILFHGIKWEHDLPYTGVKAKTCSNAKMEEKKLSLRITNWRRIPIEREVFEATLREQPILIEASLPADFKSYSGGIHSGKNCKESMRHGVLLVGYGEKDGKPFWLIRNSFGSGWGSNGYFRMSRDMPAMDKCFPSAFVAKFHFDDLAEDAPEEFYSKIKYQPPAEKLKLAAHGLTRSLLAMKVIPADDDAEAKSSDKSAE